MIESDGSPLTKISNRDVTEYIRINHGKFTSIEPSFFVRLSINYQPRRFKGFNVKLKKEKMRTFIQTESQTERKDYMKVESQVVKSINFLESLVNKAQQTQQATSHFSGDPSKVLETHVTALAQLDNILIESDFERNITSPRTFYVTAENLDGRAQKPIIKVESRTPNNKKSDRYLVRRVPVSGPHYHEMKKDKQTFSLKQIFKDRDLTFKNLDDKVEQRLNKVNEFETFQDLKRRFKAQYSAHPVTSKVYMGHLTPNRTTYGFLNVIEIKPARHNNFFDTALEHFVNKESQPSPS